MRNASLLSALGLLLAAGSAQAETVRLTVTVHNLAPASGIAFAPLHVGLQRRQLRCLQPRPGAAGDRAHRVGGRRAAPAVPGRRPSRRPTRAPCAAPSAALLLCRRQRVTLSFLVDGASNPFFTLRGHGRSEQRLLHRQRRPDASTQLFDANGQLQISSITVQGARDLGRRLRGLRPRRGGLRRRQRPARRTRTRWWPSTLPSWPPSTACRPAPATPSNSGLAADTDVYRIRLHGVSAGAGTRRPWALMAAGLPGRWVGWRACRGVAL
jgi:hypothetical protein